jgi:hypothetical protein
MSIKSKILTIILVMLAVSSSSILIINFAFRLLDNSAIKVGKIILLFIVFIYVIWLAGYVLNRVIFLSRVINKLNRKFEENNIIDKDEYIIIIEEAWVKSFTMPKL